jgi:hypothetical protein
MHIRALCLQKGSLHAQLFLLANLSGSCTPGTMGRRLWPKKSRYDLVLSSGKQLENHIPHIGYGPITPG